jgi:excisionase family DNA binding protein
MQDVLTLEEVAEYLRVHRATIYRLLKKNKIPGFRVGGDWRFNRESIDRWRAALEKQPEARPPSPPDSRRGPALITEGEE